MGFDKASFGKGLDFVIPGWNNGGRKEFWAIHATVAADLIKRENLVPTKIDILADNAKIKMTSKLPKRGFPGIPVPHLHLKGEIYLINETQWGKFSKGVISDFRSKLEGVNSVSVGLEGLAGTSMMINNLAAGKLR